MTGITTAIDGKMTTIYTGITPVEDYTKEGLSKDLLDKIDTLIPTDEIPER